MDEFGETNRGIAILGVGASDAQMMRELMTIHPRASPSGRKTVYSAGVTSRLNRWEQAALARLEEERERAEWNDAVDAKKAARQLRRAEKFWSKQ